MSTSYNVHEVLDYPETDHKGNIAVIVVHFTYIVRMVLALNESIWFAAEGFFIDSEHYIAILGSGS